MSGATRDAASALSAHAWERVCGVTQTWSPGTASRHTNPCRQVSGPNAPPPGLRLSAAWALSAHAWERACGVTQTWSPGTASRHTNPCRQVSGPYSPADADGGWDAIKPPHAVAAAATAASRETRRD